jgi:hypothetical protein
MREKAGRFINVWPGIAHALALTVGSVCWRMLVLRLMLGAGTHGTRVE